ncbi:hypothetical protein B6U90_03860 [Thermoplasmatales archaeon ex4484_6]|nr:MAG: hypothetical protein B6U90_03860 [Thermoplasmatales archaeon ex4484_6]RLF65763.1 MAG: hypothetical protein DRN57_08415 [Thermoplasmata archaeon]
MIVKIVLDGGLKSCCSVYPPEFVKEVTSIWLKNVADVEVIDRTAVEWIPDDLAALGLEHFGDRIFPLVYCGDVLASMGAIPDAATLAAMAMEKMEYGITRDDILKVIGEEEKASDNGNQR